MLPMVTNAAIRMIAIKMIGLWFFLKKLSFWDSLKPQFLQKTASSGSGSLQLGQCFSNFITHFVPCFNIIRLNLIYICYKLIIK